MDTALRRFTSNWGNSAAASGLAEYTLAPASLTTIYCTPPPISLITWAANCSVSAPAVPLPMAMICTPYF